MHTCSDETIKKINELERNINITLENIKENGVEGEKVLGDRTVGVETMKKVGTNMGNTDSIKTIKLNRQTAGRIAILWASSHSDLKRRGICYLPKQYTQKE